MIAGSARRGSCSSSRGGRRAARSLRRSCSRSRRCPSRSCSRRARGYAGSMFRVFPWATVHAPGRAAGARRRDDGRARHRARLGRRVRLDRSVTSGSAACSAAGIWVRRRTLGEVELALALGACARSRRRRSGSPHRAKSHLFFSVPGARRPRAPRRSRVRRARAPHAFAIVCGVVLGGAARVRFHSTSDGASRDGMTLPAERHRGWRSTGPRSPGCASISRATRCSSSRRGV